MSNSWCSGDGSGQFHSNPWEDVAVVGNSTTGSLHSSSLKDEAAAPAPVSQSPEDDESPPSCLVKSMRPIVHIGFVVDGVLGLVTLSATVVLAAQQSTSSSNNLVALLAWISGWTLLRAFIGTFVIFRKQCSACCRVTRLLQMASHISLLLALCYLVLSGICLIMGSHRLETFLENSCQKQLPAVAWTLLQAHMSVVWFVLLVCFKLEAVRWAFLQQYKRRILYDQQEYDEIQRLRMESGNLRTPWWWRRPPQHSGLQEPLLPEDASSTGWFGLWKSNRSDQDDGSVVFASVQEDWISRSEADPYWWSRDADDEENNGGDNPTWARQGDAQNSL